MKNELNMENGRRGWKNRREGMLGKGRTLKEKENRRRKEPEDNNRISNGEECVKREGTANRK